MFPIILLALLAQLPHTKGDALIGAFNIQTFGQTKYNNATLRSHLVDIVTQYDLLLIQEIKDVKETMIYKFLSDCKAAKPSLDLIISPRLGVTSYKEQYAIFYDSNKFSVKKHTVYANPQGVFSRPPIIAHFTSKVVSVDTFSVFGAHVDPDDVVEELEEFPAAYTWAVAQGYPRAAIFMGDLNADCSYLSNTKYTTLEMYGNKTFTWLIDKSLDTTVSTTTDCAYDRIVLCGVELKTSHFKETTVDLFDKGGMSNALARKVSDHYPVKTIWIGKENDKNDAASKAISHYKLMLTDMVCRYLPALAKHRNDAWFEASIAFLLFVVILVLRRVCVYFNLIYQ